MSAELGKKIDQSGKANQENSSFTITIDRTIHENQSILLIHFFVVI